jgi:hypothetical protein
MKNAVLWDVTPCGPIRTDVSEECNASIIRVIRLVPVPKDRSTMRVIPTSPSLFNVMMKAIYSSET